VKIITPSLLLREFAFEDWPAIHTYQRTPLYLRYYDWETRSEEDVREFVGWQVAAQSVDPRTSYKLAIELRETGELIGNCGVRIKGPGPRVADLGYEFNPAFWRQGYATEAVAAMMRFGFEELGLHRLWAECIGDNEGSWRLMEKLGMQREARLREHEYFKGRWWDKLIYGILEDDWVLNK
jgi:RimJ/RimL family protein N-acetyltransferase